MFSWGYARRAVESVIRTPGALASLLGGGDPGEVIYNKRMDEWSTTRKEYLLKPKDTFGFKIFLNPDDMSQTSALIAASGWLNLPVTCLLLKLLRPGMNVVDVGANIGFYTLLSAKAVGRTGRVWGFEPEAQNFGLMAKSIQASGFGNIEPIQTALADRPGQSRLYLAPASEPNAHTLTRDRGVGSVDVLATSLDEFWLARGAVRLDLLKIHVFGDEPVVLRGAMRVLRECRPMVLTRFGSVRWSDDPGLLESLSSWYDLYEIVESPSLIRPITKSALLALGRRGIFLSPKSG
jgi:FkbM family methyltransferase